MRTNATIIRRSYGYSLIEMLVYIALLSLIFLLLLNTTLSFASSYRELAALRAADHAGVDSMERLTREIRDATDLDNINSVFDSHPGTLVLINGTSTLEFYLQNGYLHLDIDGVYAGPLTGSSTAITNLVFTRMSTTTSSAVKIDMTVQGISGQTTKTKQFHSTVVIKNS